MKQQENEITAQASQVLELRGYLFDQIKRLNDPNIDINTEIERAKAIASIGTVIINSQKIENDFIRLTRGSNGGGKKNGKLLTNG